MMRGLQEYGFFILKDHGVPLELLQRAYGEEAVDILQTVALVLAELIVAGGLITRLELNAGFSSGGQPVHMEGVSLGRGLGFLLVAEGVENVEQLTYLRSVGCDLVQGYLFAKPMPAEMLTPWIKTHERRATATA
mgnify:CR=1 FL=1